MCQLTLVVRIALLMCHWAPLSCGKELRNFQTFDNRMKNVQKERKSKSFKQNDKIENTWNAETEWQFEVISATLAPKMLEEIPSLSLIEWESCQGISHKHFLELLCFLNDSIARLSSWISTHTRGSDWNILFGESFECCMLLCGESECIEIPFKRHFNGIILLV